MTDKMKSSLDQTTTKLCSIRKPSEETITFPNSKATSMQFVCSKKQKTMRKLSTLVEMKALSMHFHWNRMRSSACGSLTHPYVNEKYIKNIENNPKNGYNCSLFFNGFGFLFHFC